jgi:hypothetical protein
MLESAVYFITNITAEHLRMSEHLFEMYYSGAIPHHRPLSKGKFFDESKWVSVFFNLKELSEMFLEGVPKSTKKLSKRTDEVVMPSPLRSLELQFSNRDPQTITIDEVPQLFAEYQQLLAIVRSARPGLISVDQ